MSKSMFAQMSIRDR